MKIDCDVEARMPQPPAERHIVGHASQAASSRQDDQLVQVWISPENWRRWWFDDVGDVPVRVGAPQTADERRSEDDVTNEAGTNEQDSQGSIVASSMSMTGMSSLIG